MLESYGTLKLFKFIHINRLVIIKTMLIKTILSVINRRIILINDKFFRSFERSSFFLIPKKELIILNNHIKE